MDKPIKSEKSESPIKRGALGVSGALFIQERLFRYLQSGRVHPALLLVGPNKEKKFEIAKAISKSFFCTNKGTSAYCNQCSPCLRIEKEIHPDVYFLKDNGDEDNLKIENIREVTGQMNVSPIEGPNKVCVVEEVHRLNASSANAFLKTLEEPGPGRYFILLTSHIGSLLPTLLSRCIEFSFPPEKSDSLSNEADTQKYRDLIEQVVKKKDPSLVGATTPKKEDALGFVHYLQSEIRNAITTNSRSSTPKFLSSYTPFELSIKFEDLTQLEGRLRSNANYGLMLESLLRNHFIGA